MTVTGYRAPWEYSPPVRPDDAEWAAWTPQEAARRLAGVEAPWAVSAGWAIDLFLGRERRQHEDLEIGVPADRFNEVASALGELEFHIALHPPPLRRVDRAHDERDPVPAAGGGAALQGEALAAEGRVRSGGGAATPQRRTATAARRLDRASTPRALLAA